MVTCLIAAVLAACGGAGMEPQTEPPAYASGHGVQLAAAAVPTPAAAGANSSSPALAAPAAGAASAASVPASAALEAPGFAPPSVVDTGAPAPVVFNASRSARAGDIVSLQGEEFGSAPLVWLEAEGSTPLTALSVLNQVGTGWIAVQIPSTATGALALRISNGANTSARIQLNAATPYHLDATQIVPGGAFRVFGRNLLLPGSTPTVTVDGLPATVNLGASDEHMLAVTAPAGLRASSAAAIAVDNGNGTGHTLLERKVAVITGASGDPLGLGVGWGAGFAPLMARTIDAARDARLASRVVCDGRTDDSAALKGALVFASRNGGGVVQLPAGVCVLSQGVQIFSNTVLQGSGRDATELRHSTDSAIFASGTDLVALRNFALTNTASAATSSLNLKHGSRLAVQGLRVNQGHSAMAWIYGHDNLVVRDSEFLQTGSVGATGAAHLSSNTGLVFTGNRISFLNNIGTCLDRVSDAYIQGNTWTRDAIRQYDPGVVHVVTLNFAHRIALLGNTFTAINGPIDPAKNDGETLLTEGGGASRTEGIGKVATAAADSLTDPSARLNANVPVNGRLPENFGITIVAGKGAGQTRRVTAFNAGSFTVDRPWDVRPDASSLYASAVWGLEKALIKGNQLSNNPRGILLYSTAVREVDIVNNRLQENGGILVRAFQKLADQAFTPIVGVRLDGNTIVNSRGRYPTHLSMQFANLDGQPYGMSHIGIELRRNTLVANSPNIDATRTMGPAAREGYTNLMTIESASFVAGPAPRLLGTVMQDNICTNCATAFRLGTGAVGTMLSGNVLVDSGGLWSNTATAVDADKALVTWVR